MTPALLPSQVLSAAADLVEPEGAWTQSHGARAASGAITGAASPDAVCWCIYGAMIRAGTAFADAESFYVARALGLEDFTDAFDWNDAPERTQAEVVAALRKAAELARGEGQ